MSRKTPVQNKTNLEMRLRNCQTWIANMHCIQGNRTIFLFWKSSISNRGGCLKSKSKDSYWLQEMFRRCSFFQRKRYKSADWKVPKLWTSAIFTTFLFWTWKQLVKIKRIHNFSLSLFPSSPTTLMNQWRISKNSCILSASTIVKNLAFVYNKFTI